MENDKTPEVTPERTPENVGNLSGGEQNNGKVGAGTPGTMTQGVKDGPAKTYRD